MAGHRALLLFVGDDGIERWIRLADGEVEASGAAADLEDLPDGPDQVVAVVPGDRVALHWIDLPGASSAPQAMAAARLKAADLAAQPVNQLHVAVSSPAADGPACIAIVARDAMASWMAALRERGFDPGLLIPATLLLPPCPDGLVRRDFGGLAHFRGMHEAFALEPPLAQGVVADRPVAEVSDELLDLATAEQVARPLLNLRQGPFAKRRRVSAGKGWLRRNLLIGTAILLATLGMEIAAIARDIGVADEMEARAIQRAQIALGDGPPVTDPQAQLRGRLAELGGGRAGLTALAATLFSAVKETPNVELSGFAFESGAGLAISVRADVPAALEAVRARLEAAGYEVAESVASAEGAARWSVKPR